MDSKKLKELTEKILQNTTDISVLTNCLEEFRQDNETLETKVVEYNNKIETLTGDNENLRATNMKFFLKLGQQEEEQNKTDKPEDNNDETLKETLTFDKLFNEKGELI